MLITFHENIYNAYFSNKTSVLLGKTHKHNPQKFKVMNLQVLLIRNENDSLKTLKEYPCIN